MNHLANQLNQAQGSQKIQHEDPPPVMDLEWERLSQSVAELNASVVDLLARIAKVCQPSELQCAEQAHDSAGGKIASTPSEFRGRLMSLRARVDDISHLIAPVKCRIEI